MGTAFHLLTYKWILHMCIRPNVTKTKQLEHQHSQNLDLVSRYIKIKTSISNAENVTAWEYAK